MCYLDSVSFTKLIIFFKQVLQGTQTEMSLVVIGFISAIPFSYCSLHFKTHYKFTQDVNILNTYKDF